MCTCSRLGCAVPDPGCECQDEMDHAFHRSIAHRLTEKTRAAGVTRTTPLFYIQDTRQVVGNCALWWSPNACGYTCDLDAAGLYTKDETSKGHRETDKSFPREVVERAAVSHVRVEKMRELVTEEKK